MDLLDRLRDLIVLAAVPGAGASGLLDASEDQLDRMRKQATEFGQDRLAAAAETISNGLVEMRGATSPRLLLELMCAQVLLPAAPAHDESAEGSTSSELAARVERLERQLANAAVTKRQESPAPADRPGTGSGGRPGTGSGGRPRTAEAAVRTGSDGGSNGGQSAAGTPADQHPAERGQATGSEASATLDLDVLQSRWADVLEAVREVRKTAWILLSNYASIDVVEGNVLTMAFDTEGNAKGFANSGSDGYLADVLYAMFGVRPVIRAIVNPAGGRGAARGPARPAGDDHGGAGGRATQAPGLGGRPDSGRRDSGRSDSGRQSGRGDGGGDDGAWDTGPAPVSAPAGAGRRPSVGQELSGTGDPTGRPGARRGAGSRSSPAESPGQAADAGGQPRSGAPTRRAAQPRDSRGRASAVSPRSQPAGSDLPDDPRPHTDAAAGDETDDLTGTDLVMRELGGRVIEEITDI